MHKYFKHTIQIFDVCVFLLDFCFEQFIQIGL